MAAAGNQLIPTLEHLSEKQCVLDAYAAHARKASRLMIAQMGLNDGHDISALWHGQLPPLMLEGCGRVVALLVICGTLQRSVSKARAQLVKGLQLRILAAAEAAKAMPSSREFTKTFSGAEERR